MRVVSRIPGISEEDCQGCGLAVFRSQLHRVLGSKGIRILKGRRHLAERHGKAWV